jgi:hypothetical protein
MSVKEKNKQKQPDTEEARRSDSHRCEAVAAST